jgi:hypothetical protein
MTWAVPQAYEAPGAPTGAQWTFSVRVKAFEANTPALLETSMNAWMTLLDDVNLADFAILSVNYQSGAKEKALVTYGYFVQVTPT